MSINQIQPSGIRRLGVIRVREIDLFRAHKSGLIVLSDQTLVHTMVCSICSRHFDEATPYTPEELRELVTTSSGLRALNNRIN